jgi:hypothetical protein
MSKISVPRESVTQFLVSVDGKIDVDQSVAKFREACMKHVATTEGNDELIETCLMHLYDTFPGASFNRAYICSSVVRLMATSKPELGEAGLFANLAKRINGIVAAKVESGEYASKLGPTGGTCRVSDQAPEAVAAPVVTQ